VVPAGGDASGVLRDEPLDERGGDGHLAGGGVMDAASDLLGGHALEQTAAGACGDAEAR